MESHRPRIIKCSPLQPSGAHHVSLPHRPFVPAAIVGHRPARRRPRHHRRNDEPGPGPILSLLRRVPVLRLWLWLSLLRRVPVLWLWLGPSPLGASPLGLWPLGRRPLGRWPWGRRPSWWGPSPLGDCGARQSRVLPKGGSRLFLVPSSEAAGLGVSGATRP